MDMWREDFSYRIALGAPSETNLNKLTDEEEFDLVHTVADFILGQLNNTVDEGNYKIEEWKEFIDLKSVEGDVEEFNSVEEVLETNEEEWPHYTDFHLEAVTNEDLVITFKYDGMVKPDITEDFRPYSKTKVVIEGNNSGSPAHQAVSTITEYLDNEYLMDVTDPLEKAIAQQGIDTYQKMDRTVG